MKFEINEAPMTTDELRAHHGDTLWGVKYVLDSNDPGPAVLEVTLQQKHYTVLRYVSDGKKWHLQAVTIDANEHLNPPRDGVIDHIFARIKAADKALNPRNTKGDA
jgi:hypothetical protein